MTLERIVLIVRLAVLIPLAATGLWFGFVAPVVYFLHREPEPRLRVVER